MLRAKRAERGQAFPLWIVAIITTFALMMMALNYGNAIRWQIRAQNAADAAAQALMAIQTERWNEMTIMLYASSVEEFRIRRTLDAILLTMSGAGGCNSDGLKFDNTGPGSCEQTYSELVPNFNRAVARYTTDVQRVNDVTSLATYTNWQADMKKLLVHLKTRCNSGEAATVNSDGGDCAFQYTLNGVGQRQASNYGGGLSAVEMDANITLVPTNGNTDTNYPVDTENKELFAPGMVDVVVCTKVLPLIAGLGPVSFKPYYAIGRAGSTAVMFEEDWMQPGTLFDTAGRPPNTPFQPVETPSKAAVTYGPGDWYGVDFGGNPGQIQHWNDGTGKAQQGYTTLIQNNEFQTFAGFWSAIPMDPRKMYATAQALPTQAAVCPP